jgi:hypothetical protein
MDFASDHTIVFPLLALLFCMCQAGCMVAAANFGTNTPLRERCMELHARARSVSLSIKICKVKHAAELRSQILLLVLMTQARGGFTGDFVHMLCFRACHQM